MHESLAHEKSALASDYNLLEIVEGHSVLLEEYAHKTIVNDELHQDEFNKMLRSPCDTATFKG